MNVHSVRFWGWSLLLLAGACAAKRLPPGTPPPEYEPRPLMPWNEGPSSPPPAHPEPPAASAEPSDAGAAQAPDSAVEAPDAGLAAPDGGPGAFPERAVE